MNWKAIVVALLLGVAVPLVSQVVPSATDRSIQLKIGAGFADYSGDLNNGQLWGGALWIDGIPPMLPHFLSGWGLEVEARGVQATQKSPTERGAFRQATFGGGPTYTWRRYRNFRPYAKFLFDFAGQNFNIGDKAYRHETQTAFALGGGIDYRIAHHLWMRGDYEYQVWPDPFSNTKWILDPEGITVGVLWEFGSVRGR